MVGEKKAYSRTRTDVVRYLDSPYCVILRQGNPLPDEGSPLLVLQPNRPTPPEAVCALHDPEQRNNRKHQRRPMHERALMHRLVREDRPQTPRDRHAGGEVSLRAGECVGSSGGLEEQQGEEDEDLGSDGGVVLKRVGAEGFEGGEDDEDGGPAVVQAEGEVDEQLVGDVDGCVMLLHDIINVRHGGGDEQGEDEGDDVMVVRPDVDVDGVEDGQQGEPPGDAVDDDALAGGEELVDDISEEKDVDDGPNVERIRRWGDIGLLSSPIWRLRPSDSIDIGSSQEDVR